MNNKQIVLLDFIAPIKVTAPYVFPISIDWSLLLQEALDQTIVGLVVPTVKKYAEDHDVQNLNQWTSISDQLYAFFVVCFQAQRELVELFEDNGIPLVIVKGYAAAVNYPVPKLRTMGDVDFLVPKDRFEDAKVLMEKSGYSEEYGASHEESRHIGYKKNGIVFEMHRSMSSFGVDIDDVLEKAMVHADTGTIAGISFPMLPPLENGLVLLIHIRQHLMEEAYSLGLRQIIDWMMYVNRYCGTEIAGSLWYDKFLELAETYGMGTLAATVTYICREWLGLPNAPKWCDGADRQTAKELLEMIMESGNFGSKVDRKGQSVKQGIVNYKQFGFKRLQERGLANWKAAKKYPVLRPFAWIYQGFRVIGLGTKAFFSNKHGIKQISEGNKKGDLLKRLGV